MNTILLDTHVLLWAALSPQRLSRAAKRALGSASRRLVADITLRELAMLADAGTIQVDGSIAEFLEDLVLEQKLAVVPIDSRIAARSTHIAQNFRGDPADQLIAATAIELDVPLVTADERLRASPAIRTIW